MLSTGYYLMVDDPNGEHPSWIVVEIDKPQDGSNLILRLFGVEKSFIVQSILWVKDGPFGKGAYITVKIGDSLHMTILGSRIGGKMPWRKDTDQSLPNA